MDVPVLSSVTQAYFQCSHLQTHRLLTYPKTENITVLKCQHRGHIEINVVLMSFLSTVHVYEGSGLSHGEIGICLRALWSTFEHFL